MFERGIRGGITQAVHKHGVANNQYMGSDYDKSRPSEYLQYWMQITYTVGQCRNLYPLVDLGGLGLIVVNL